MSKISGWNLSQSVTSADNCRQKNEDLDTWYVGMSDFARTTGGQNSRSNILFPRVFLEFLAKIFTLGCVDLSKRSNEAGRNMMAHVKLSSCIKNNDGSEMMKSVTNNPEGGRANLSKVEIEITLASVFNSGIREGHIVVIFPQPDGPTNRYEGESFERRDESSLHLITNEILVCYQCEANKEIARLLNIPQELNNSQDLNNSQVSCKDSVDSMITDLLGKPLNSALLIIRKEHPLLMPYVCNESIPYLLGEKEILKEIGGLNAANNYLLNNKKVTDNEANDIKVNLSHILIDSLDDIRINLVPVTDLILETFSKFPYISDIGILDWCFNKRVQYFGDSEKIRYACSVMNHIDFSHDQSKDFSYDQSKVKIAEALFFSLNKEHYKNSHKLQELVWDKLVTYINDFNLNNQEKSRLILRLFDDVKLLLNEVLVGILVNDIFLRSFFVERPDSVKWYFYQLLKGYEGEQLHLNELGYVYGSEEKTNEIVKNNPGCVVKTSEEKMANELKIRTRVMRILQGIYVQQQKDMDGIVGLLLHKIM